MVVSYSQAWHPGSPSGHGLHVYAFLWQFPSADSSLLSLLSPPPAATEVTTVFIFHEPSQLSALQDNGLPWVVLDSIISKQARTCTHTCTCIYMYLYT